MSYDKKLAQHVLKVAFTDEVIGISTVLTPSPTNDFTQVNNTVLDTKVQIQCLSKDLRSFRISGLSTETGDIEYVVGKLGDVDKELGEKIHRFLTKTGRI